METIFDHKVTKEEIKYLFGNPEITKEEFLSFGLSQVQHLVGIYKLYMIRNDNEKADEYLQKAKKQGYFQFKLWINRGKLFFFNYFLYFCTK